MATPAAAAGAGTQVGGTRPESYDRGPRRVGRVPGGVPDMTTTPPEPRSGEQRRCDVLGRLEGESDIWVASADSEGLPCLVPLWFLWDGRAVWLSMRDTNPTGRNLRDRGRARWRSETPGTSS